MEKILPLLSVLLWVFLWSAGGFLILINTIKTRRHETTLLGLGLGLILQVWLANLIGRLLAPIAAFVVLSLLWGRGETLRPEDQGAQP